jgi:hypothetical protein
MSETEEDGYRIITVTHTRERRGTMTLEFTNKGRSSVRYFRGAKPVYTYRWCAQIMINRKRHRMRSTNYNNCRAWLDDMIAKAGPIVTTRTMRIKI